MRQALAGRAGFLLLLALVVWICPGTPLAKAHPAPLMSALSGTPSAALPLPVSDSLFGLLFGFRSEPLSGSPSGSLTGAVAVAIVAPEGHEPVFGTVEVEAEVTAEEPVESVSLLVNGRLAGELSAPPFRWSVDVGQENRRHRFQVVASTASGALAQATLETPAYRVDLEVAVELQQVYVTALGSSGERVMDLKRSEFSVSDDGRPQDLVTFERGDVPMTAVLLVDASRSMRGRPLEAALEGARRFVRGTSRLDQVRLVLFSDRLLHAAPFTNVTEVVFAGLSTVEAQGGTALNDSLYGALKELEARPGRRVVILLSDGVDTASVLSMEDVLPGVRRSGALIYWLRTGATDPNRLQSSSWRNGDRHRREQEQLQRAVEESGGRQVVLGGLEESTAAFGEILQELRDQYVLGFYPTDAAGDGRWHELEVKVRRPGIRLRTREGYLDW